jgi:signal transduction histidine kinase
MMEKLVATTHFLPAERDCQADLLAAAEVFRTSGFGQLLDGLPLCSVVLNDKRQIIYANAKFYEFVEADRLEDVLGVRTGEALGCVHPEDSEGGCGTTRFCRYCGAARAMLRSLDGEPGTQECSIMRRFLNRLEGLNLQVWSTPIHVDGRLVILFSMVEIGHEKTLENVTSVFFQEILARVGGVKGVAGMLERTAGEEAQGEVGLLHFGLDSIRRLVQSQKDFFDVEHGRYLASPGRIEVRTLLAEVVRSVELLDVAEKRDIRLIQARPGLFLVSDERLLSNALAQLLVNALEAVPPLGRVSIGCTERDGQVVFTVSNPGALSEAERMQMFKRSFSTKGPGRGLGAYMAKVSVENCLGGSLDFESGGEGGTVFFLRLPAKP